MIRRMSLVVIAMSLGVLLQPAVCLTAGDDPKARLTLKGLESVYVQVECLDPELEKAFKKANLTSQGLRKAVERELEKGEIKVVYEEDLQKAKHYGILYVKLDIFPPEATRKYKYTIDGEQIKKGDSDEKVFYTIDLELRQVALLLRDPAIQQQVATWSRSTMGFRRISRIEADVRDQVQGFTEAYSDAKAH